MNRQLSNKSHVYNALKTWVEALDLAVFQVYKTTGTQRIHYICNEIYDMEKNYITNTDEEIDAFNALIDIHTNQIARIQKCQKQIYENDGMKGLSALFHEHPVCKSKIAFVHFLYAYNEVYNVDVEKYVDEFGNIIKTSEGFDFIYENVFINNPLFNALQMEHIKKELVLLKAPIIIQMCKN
jgi:hypothetical protein